MATAGDEHEVAHRRFPERAAHPRGNLSAAWIRGWLEIPSNSEGNTQWYRSPPYLFGIPGLTTRVVRKFVVCRSILSTRSWRLKSFRG